ncbi:MAG: hypothetical protein Q8882_04885 [Bacillota bacterium]|nr:hypothetical protein [Bacillota bacterium]
MNLDGKKLYVILIKGWHGSYSFGNLKTNSGFKRRITMVMNWIEDEPLPN